MAKKKAPAKKVSAQKKVKASANGGLKFLPELRSLLSGEKALLSVVEKVEQKKATHTELLKLRDGIREKAVTLRAKKKTDEARRFSDINRHIRRLERAAR